MTEGGQVTETQLQCACGAMRAEVTGRPIAVTECLCDSCREAAERMARLPGARSIVTEIGGTICVEYRKDRVEFLSGHENLKAFRLTPKSGTRRVIATCCNTPVFIEAKGGHWLSLYGGLWPEGAHPPVQLRTMVGDLPEGTELPDDVPNRKRHSAGFMGRLFLAWAAMGFRNPKLTVNEGLDV